MYCLGIDIGGTNTVFGIVDARGTIVKSGSIKTAKYELVEDYVDALSAELLKVIKEADCVDNIQGIGIGAPNGNHYKGTIEFAPNLPWKGIVPLAEMITKQTGIPVNRTTDANAAATGEMTYSDERGMKNFSMIIHGRGVVSGIVIN